MLGLCLQSIITTLRGSEHDVLSRFAAIAGVVVCGALFLASRSLFIRGRLRTRQCVLTVLLCVLTLVLIVTHGAWALLGLAMTAVTLSWSWPVAAPALLALNVAGGVLVAVMTDQIAWAVFSAGFAILMTAVLYSLTRLTVVLGQLERARAQLARAEVAQERDRIARDLHDIIGRTLVAVSFRVEAAAALLPKNPRASNEQLDAASHAITEGQRQLRTLTDGPVLVSLESEVESSRRLLERIGITCAVHLPEVIPSALETVLAELVRESVTNALKHSRPRHCWITIRGDDSECVAAVVNDGVRDRDPILTSDSVPHGATFAGAMPVPPPRADPRNEGTGLRRLQEHVQDRGGVLECGPLRGGHYRVHARFPVPAAHASTVPGGARSMGGQP